MPPQTATIEEDAMEGEVSILLVITVVIGTVLMTSLLVCYICVFKQLCCSNELERSQSCRSGKRTFGTTQRTSSGNMAELTHISNPTEIERV